MSTLIQAALGRFPCDLILKNAKIFDAWSGRFFEGEVAVWNGQIAGVEPGLKGEREIDVRGKWVVPGFIDAHVHIESSCMVPGLFEQVVLPRGTTTAICDPHEIANVQGVKGIRSFVEASNKTRLSLKVMLSSCVPATSLETNGGGSLSALDLQPFVGHENVLGLAEVMNVPAVLMEDAEMMAKLKLMPQSRKDGHAPLLRGLQLSAYACAGITSCHESSEEEEAVEKIRKGMAVWIREGSVAKDLASLVRLIDPYRSAAVGFCTDDRNPLDVAQEGHLDFLIRKAIRLGAPVEAVYRASSWSVARHYGLLDRGAISPGMRADLVVLDDLNECRVNSVFQQGRLTSELEFDPSLCASRTFENSIVANVPTEQELKGPEGRVHVMEIIAGKIITDRSVRDSNERGVHAMTVLERYGNGHPPSNAYVRGFGETFQGAIASSVGHDSHNLAVVGSNPSDMKVALSHLIESGGGFCVVQNSKILADLLLPYAGLMTARPLPEVTQKLRNLREASRRIGCVLEEPFLQLAFLCLPVIPSLKLTDRGLVDVNQFQIIPVRA